MNKLKIIEPQRPKTTHVRGTNNTIKIKKVTDKTTVILVR